jgi:hypothetical protein
MHPLLTFASGLLAGIVGVKLLNKATPPAAQRLETLGGKARHGLAQAQSGLRDATVTGLEAIEKSSASLRAKLAPAAAEPAAAKPRAPRKAAAPKAKAAPRAKAGAKAKAAPPADGGTTS